MEQVKSVEVVEFDAWESVKRDGDMVVGMKTVVMGEGKKIAWGPERGWRKEVEGEKGWFWVDAVAGHGGGLVRTKVVFSPSK